ncbi:MAG: protein kinase domain-containing protein [Limisphaerales bacterium]
MAGAPTERPPQIPDHRLLRCIGRGSYGSVWLAQNIMGSYRAVKVVDRHDFEDNRPFEREFKGIQKFEPISRQHDSQVDILHVGRVGDWFYYVMEVADDERSGQQIDPARYRPRTLASELKQRGRLSFDECVQIGLALTTALAHLHKHGLIHRDIKPANVIFVNGVPKLADIGLVTEITATRSFVGTEGFIPPEGPGTVRADIYSLGKVLYELATGRDRRDFPELPTMLRESLEKEKLVELNEVILRACELDPSRRYAAAEEMHADLALLQTGKSLKQHRLTERRLRAARRAVLVAVSVALLAGTAYYEAKQAEKNATDRLVQMNVANGVTLTKEGDVLGSLLWFAKAVELGHGRQPLDKLNRLRIAASLDQCFRLNQVFFHQALVNDAEFSPDGRFLVTASFDHTARIWDLATGQARTPPLQHLGDVRCAEFSPDGRWVVTASTDHAARVWDATTGQPVSPELRHASEVVHASFSPDGRLVVTASADHTAQIWNARTGQPFGLPLQHSSEVVWAAFSPDGRRVVTASWDHTARIWETETGKPIGASLTHQARVRVALFSPDGRHVGTASDDSTARIWDAATGQPLTGPLRHQASVLSIAFSPDGTLFASASKDYSAQVWDAHTGEPLTYRLVHGNRVTRVAFSPDGRWLLTASGDHTTKIWEARTGEPITWPLKHNGGVITAGFSPNGDQVVTAGHDDTVRVWDLSGPSSGRLALPGDGLTWSRFSPDGSYLSTYNPADRLLRMWQVGKGRRMRQPSAVTLLTRVPASPQELRPRVACFSPAKDRPWLLYTDLNEARVWDFRAGRIVATLRQLVASGLFSRGQGHVLSPQRRHEPRLWELFSPDGRRVAAAVGHYYDQVWVWDAATGQPVTTLVHGGQPCCSLAFSPDGRRLVVGYGNPTQQTNGYARVWDATTGQPLTAPMKHPAAVIRVSFSPDGRHILTGCDDDSSNPMEARIWEATTGQPVGPPLRHGDGINAAKWSPDGARVLTASQDGTARVWNARTGEPVTPPLEHARQVQDADFSPDGRLVVTACVDGTIRVWDAATGQPVSPPLGHKDGVDHPWFSVGFSPDGRRILSAGGQPGSSQNSAAINPSGTRIQDEGGQPPAIWYLGTTDMEAPELMAVAQAMTGQWIDQSGAAVPLEAGAYRSISQQIRSRRPELFATPADQTVRWHREQAEDCERDHEWFAALFHLDRLLALQPGDRAIAPRRAAAKAALDRSR